MFTTPLRIDTTATAERPVPESWKSIIQSETVAVLPLVDDHDARYAAGWCTYENTLEELPNVEFISGGINSKTPHAVGIWRQGNLLHFGFEQSPAEMNATGRALLINSISYIARFTEDPAIVRVPSPFAGSSYRARSSLAAWLKNEDYLLEWFEQALDADVRRDVEDRTRSGYQQWYEANRKYLRPVGDGLLGWDQEARQFGLAYDSHQLFTVAIAALRHDHSRDAAAMLLARYVPDGPADRNADDWQRWYEAHQPYLFYSEWGGYRWYIDQLAMQRGIPTAELRGPQRADRQERAPRRADE